ncbi:MAG TPA: hypothetical protein VIO61_17750 [Anaerolineaceae bacterium]
METHPGIVDRIKCPDWMDIIEPARAAGKIYIHFPLRLGEGDGDFIDTETGSAPDWKRIEDLLRITETKYLNFHFWWEGEDTPLDPAQVRTAEIDRLVERACLDIQPVVRRFGAERVIMENLPDFTRTSPQCLLPGVIRCVVEETGIGFLYDIAHGRLAARKLRIDEREYVKLLPLERTREVHITGIQPLEGHWLNLLEQAGMAERVFAEIKRGEMDHLPLADGDWIFFGWVLQQLCSRTVALPEIVAFEYGGVSGVLEALGELEYLNLQTPRLKQMIREAEKCMSLA